MEQVFSVEEMMGLKCPHLVVNEIEVETSESPAGIPPSKATKPKEVDFFEPADYANGALFEESNYCWSQSINEIGE